MRLSYVRDVGGIRTVERMLRLTGHITGHRLAAIIKPDEDAHFEGAPRQRPTHYIVGAVEIGGRLHYRYGDGTVRAA